MNRIVFVEDFSPNFDYSKHLVVALDGLSHYNLLKRDIAHYCISDFMEFKSYLKYADEYNEIRTSFFESCDEYFKSMRINDDLAFAPFHIMPMQFACIFDSLFSQSLIILEVLRQLNPKDVILISSYKPSDKAINYINGDKIERGYYDYLNYEIINYFSKYFDYRFNTQIVNKNRIEKIKGWVKEKVKNKKVFNLYQQLNKVYKDRIDINNNSIDTSFDYLKGKKVLFSNQSWGLDKLIKFILNNNNTTFILENDYLFKYQGPRLKNTSKLKCKNYWKSNQVYTGSQENSKVFNNFIQNALGVPIEDLIQRRLSYINQTIVPSLFNKSYVIDNMLKTLKIEYIIGNMKYDGWRYILAYIGTYKKDYEFIYFTHGYDMFDVDRTFLELPCNKYYTMNNEFKDYLAKQFNNQNFYIKPKKVLVSSEIL